MFSGSVVWFDDAKGLGFIRRDDGTEWFIHYRNIVCSPRGHRTLFANENVDFDLANDQHGRPMAVNVWRSPATEAA